MRIYESCVVFFSRSLLLLSIHERLKPSKRMSMKRRKMEHPTNTHNELLHRFAWLLPLNEKKYVVGLFSVSRCIYIISCWFALIFSVYWLWSGFSFFQRFWDSFIYLWLVWMSTIWSLIWNINAWVRLKADTLNHIELERMIERIVHLDKSKINYHA